MATAFARPVPVLLMARELDLGGSERQLTEIARSLDRTRFEPHVGCFRPDGLRADELRAAGVPIVRFPVTSFRSPSVWCAGRQLAQYIRKQKIRLVHTFDVPGTIFGVLAMRAFGRPPVVLSSQRAHRDLVSGPRRYLLRLTDRLVDGVVVNCHDVQRHLIKDERVPAKLIHLCYNGVNTEEFFPLISARPAALRDASLVIGVVCAVRQEKNLETLLEAFAEIRRDHPALKLAVVGSGPGAAALRTQSVSLGIANACVFEPSTAQVVDWLRAMDIFVLPSRSEALSNALMEAMACGCAVVASRVGGNVELVREKRTGLLFESGDSSQLSAALRLLIENEPLRKELGAAAVDLMREGFSMANAAQSMGDIYSTRLESVIP